MVKHGEGIKEEERTPQNALDLDQACRPILHGILDPHDKSGAGFSDPV